MAKNSKEKQKQYDANRAGERTRNWAVIFYPEDLPDGWDALLDETGVQWVESPLHDKDVNADGNPKKPHKHGLLMFDAVKSENQVRKFLQGLYGASEESIVGVASPRMAQSRGGMVRYMAHLDNPEKAQYDVAEIIGHNGADISGLLRYSATETREMIIAMEEYIEENGITELSDFSAAIRYDFPEWHTLLSTKMTVYFNGFIRSRRHKLEKKRNDQKGIWDEFMNEFSPVCDELGVVVGFEKKGEPQ